MADKGQGCMAICIYCAKDEKEFSTYTPPDYFTDEHVIPRAIGGNIIQRSPFLLPGVCSWCNNLCGRHVDGPFVRSWFTQMHRAALMWRYIDVTQHPAVPLAFLGTIDIVVPDGRQCDAWLGPAGDPMFHFHRRYPPEPDQPGVVGRPVHVPLAQTDAGYVFLFIAATHPDWQGTIIHSVVNEFEGADLYLANGAGPHPPPFVPVPDERAALMPQLRHLGSTEYRFEVSPYYADRFHVKVVLGLGALYLTPDFVTSDDAALLRSFLFEKDDRKRETIPVHGTSSFEGSPELANLLSWEDGHVILLKRVGNDVLLNLILFGQPGQAGHVIRVSANPTHWPPDARADDMVFVIAPGLQRATGPIDYAAYLAWKHLPERRAEIGLRELDDLKSRMDAVAGSLPPKQLEQP
jgi:hypothetical protein